MRSSVFLTGILLGIKGEVELSMPGGCKIGKRPIDLHLKALKTLGAEIEEKGEVIRCVSPKLKGAEVYFDFPSVGATENAMMAAIFAEGTTVLKNCAKEPEIEDLASFLIKCGACIKGAGTETIYIKGSKNYHSTEHTVIPDRIEGGTFLSFAATAGGKIAIKNIIPTHMKNITDAFKSMGANIKVYENSLEINRKERLKPLNIRTGIYPEFPTDMQSPLVSALCFADGVSIVKEEIFENRFNFINQLKFMKAIVEIRGKNAIINGVSQIFGAKVFAEDLRGGAALVTAALGALGETDIFGIDHIERGYEQLCYKLNCLEADIEKRS